MAVTDDFNRLHDAIVASGWTSVEAARALLMVAMRNFSARRTMDEDEAMAAIRNAKSN